MTTGKELAILNEIPEYALAPASTAAFDDLLNGISPGMPPSIRVKNGKFRIVEGGDENVIPAKKLAEGEYLPIVVLGAKRDLNKTYYAEAYDPNDEPTAPDCWSLDAVKPDASIKKPMCSSCAACPMNAFGSGKNAKGEATKGKACTDTKILAVAYSGGVYQLRIPPASLKGFGAYIRTLKQRNVPVGNVVTFVGIDESADFPMMTFHPGAFVPQERLPKLIAMAESQEVHDITHPSFAGVVLPEDAAKKEASKGPKGGPDPLGDDDGEEKKAAPKKAAPKAKPEPETNDEGEDDSPLGIPSDDELDSILGFDD